MSRPTTSMTVLIPGEDVRAGSTPSRRKRKGRLAPTRLAVMLMSTIVTPSVMATSVATWAAKGQRRCSCGSGR